jgi:hypothetical protein
MSAPLIELEGTWDEISRQIPEFDGKRLHVTVRLVEEPRAKAATTMDEALARIWKEVPDAVWDHHAPLFAEHFDSGR